MKVTIISVPDLRDHEFLSELSVGDVLDVRFDRGEPFDMVFVTFKPGHDCSVDDLLLAGVEFTAQYERY